jgi:hypothetical protein
MEHFDENENVFLQSENDMSNDDDEQHYELPHVYELLDPITVGKKKYDEVIFTKRPNGRAMAHLSLAGELKMGNAFPLIAHMIELPLSVVYEFSSRDIMEGMLPVAMHFFIDGRATGGQK